MEEKQKASFGKKLTSSFKVLPKIMKYAIIVVAILLITSTGVIFRTVLQSQTKTTKFGLENIGELVTQTAHITVVQDSKVNIDFFELFTIPFTESRQVFSYDIKVDASVNFENIYLKETNNEVLVKLNHAKIYKTTLDNESLKIYIDSNGLFTRINLEQQNQALIEMKKQAERDALANGLLEEADKNAQKLIDSLLKSDERYKDYRISFEYLDEISTDV